MRISTIALLATPWIVGSCGLPTDLSLQHESTDHAHERAIYNSSVALLARIDLWTKSVEDGVKLNQRMRTPDPSKKQASVWKNFADIPKKGWISVNRPNDPDERLPNTDELTSAASALKALGIPGLDDPSWKGVDWRHPETVQGAGKTGINKKKEYPRFRAFYNPKHSILIASKSESPSQFSKSPISLHYWSDIIFLTWSHFCQAEHINPSTLKYIVRLNIINDDVNQILEKISGVSLMKYNKPFPGDKLTGQNFAAVLGFPLGRGVANLLIQHKETFGQERHIREVQFWDSCGGEKCGLEGLDDVPNMLYTLS